MPYEITWLVEKRILNISLMGNLSIEDLRRYNLDIIRSVREGTAPVHSITDMRMLTGIPYDFAQLKGALAMLYEPGIGLVTIVGLRVAPIRYIGTLLLRSAGLRCVFLSTMTEALARILEEEPALRADLAFPPRP